MDSQMQQENQGENINDLIEMSNNQMEILKKEIESTSPLISDIIGMDVFKAEFENHSGFLMKINEIEKVYKHTRLVRRDGSCFYRAYIFRIIENIILTGGSSSPFLQETKNSFNNVKKLLSKHGYEEIIVDDFYYGIEKIFNNIEFGTYTVTDLMNDITDKMNSDYIVMFMRMATSGFLKENSGLYEAFMLDGNSIDKFCLTDVEPIDREADEIQIIALSTCLNIPVKIAYLDSTETSTITYCELPEPNPKTFVNLMYRPGHYDILYK